MTPRLLLRIALAPDALVEVADEQARYLRKVLRLDVGAAVEVFDGSGLRCAATIERLADRGCTLRLGAVRDAAMESPLQVTVAQCVSAAERMDWTIEKAVELGAAALVPLQSQRATVKLDADRARRRHAHWHRLIEAACMQCGRDRLPELAPVASLEDWLARLAPSDDGTLRVVLDPRASVRLSTLPRPGAALVLLAGPESGLSDDELSAARAAGFTAVRLGPRVLRTETAAVAALAALQMAFGDF